MTFTLARRLTAEAVGTAMLLMVVIGSGIMAERLSGGNVALALLGNSLATGCGLAVLILVFGPVSGAHFNPVITLVMALRREIGVAIAAGYVAAQLAAAFVGVAVADFMFGEPLFAAATRARSGLPQCFSEAVATFGLVVVVLGCMRHRVAAVPFAVAIYITGAYWFTSSTSFANPAATLARSVSDTFAGIRPGDTGPFIVAQLIGALAGAVFCRWLWDPVAKDR